MAELLPVGKQKVVAGRDVYVAGRDLVVKLAPAGAPELAVPSLPPWDIPSFIGRDDELALSLEYVSALNVFRGVSPSPSALRSIERGGRPIVVVHDSLVVGHYEEPIKEFEADESYEADADSGRFYSGFGEFYGDQG
jgi:hypothetical protein